MAIKGFDKAFYLSAKLEQLQNDPATAAEWAGKDVTFLENKLLNGFGLTAEAHYEQYGFQEDLAPNAFFDPAEYIRAKATAMVNDTSTSYTSVAEAEAAFVELWGGNVYLHYLQYGEAEGINPSNDFDVSGYLEAKLAALQAEGNTEITTVAELEAALEAAGLTALEHFLAYGQDEGIAAPAVPADEQVAVDDSTPGETFTLTTGTDTVEGTSGDDVIKASTGLSADGSTAIATTNALDTIDGGAGEDTLQIENTGGKNTLTGDISNVENLTFIGAGNVNNNAAVNVSDFSGTVTLSKTDDTAVNVTNVTGQTLALNEVADATVLTVAYDAEQESATLSNAEAAGDASFSISGAALETVSVSTDATATGKKVTVTDTGNTTKTFNVAASEDAAVEVESTAVENINVSGEGAVTLTTTATAPSKTLSSANSTGGVTYATALATDVLFTGGSGDDAITFGATTKAQTMGAGDDTVTLSGGTTALGTDGSIDAGEGTDTLQMAAADAATADDDDAFEGTISGFEKLSLTAATNQTVDLSNLDDIDYVVAAGDGNTLTINKMASGGTFEFADASTATAVNVTDAATGEADVLNVKVSAAANTAAGTLTVANVETVNIESDDTATTPDGSIDHSLTLTADKATTVNISGDAQIALTLTGSTEVETVDASANTAGVDVNLTVAEGITFTGSAENDTVTLGDLTKATGGEGDDTFVVTVPSAGNKYATIEDFNAEEDTIQFDDQGTETFAADAIELADTAVFQDYLDAAAAGDGSVNAALSWFEFGGNTYVVADYAAGATFTGGTDSVVKLTGSIDLSEATVGDFAFA